MKNFCFYLLALSSFFLSFETNAKVNLPSVMGDNMVLQRNSVVNIWGKASPGVEVTVVPSWNDKTYTTKADRNGKWLAKVPTGDAGGPYSITISDGEPLKLDNIMLGEVWICGGQSNMEMQVQGYTHQPVNGALDAILNAPDSKQMRFFTVEHTVCDTPQDNCGGSWSESSPEAVANFSATAFFFGKQLNDMLDVPIGLITSNWGGTAIEPWIDKTTFESVEGVDKTVSIERSKSRKQQYPGVLFNSMINPITNYTAKGFIWYQGESNLGHPDDYVILLSNMIDSWREKWGDKEMPFYLVQLAPYSYDDMNDISLPLMIEAQYKVADRVPKVGIAATTDIGSRFCIHPPFKKEVGQRLAMLALQNDYGIKGLPHPAPTFKSMNIEGNKVTLDFNNVTTNPMGWEGNTFLIHSGNEILQPQGFEIAGQDRKFYPATGVINGGKTTIEIYSDSVPNPVAVRYSFHNYIPDANVKTCLGQPLAPFRTDNWPADN